METTDMQAIKFGQPVRNWHASEGNPKRDGLFVRWVHRTGRFNPGKYAELTDGKGMFWMVIPEALAILDKIDKSGEGVTPVRVTDLLFDVSKVLNEFKEPDGSGYYQPKGGQQERLNDVHQRIDNELIGIRHPEQGTVMVLTAHDAETIARHYTDGEPFPFASDFDNAEHMLRFLHDNGYLAPAKAPREVPNNELAHAAKMLAARASANVEPGGIRWEVSDTDMKALEAALKSNTPR